MRVKADALIKEMERRKAVPKLLSACFDKQVDFIKDPSRRKALFVARRSGKTWTVAVLLIMECLLEPATKCLYFGLTSESSWNTIYLHMIEVLCRQFAIDIEVNLTQKTITFGNKWGIEIGIFKEEKVFRHLNEGIPVPVSERSEKQPMRIKRV